MDLRLGSLFLLFVSSSALTPEECEPLVAPRSLEDRSVMYGRWNFLTGYIDNNVFNSILEKFESSWINITESPNDHEVLMAQEEKLNGTCISAKTTATMEGNMATVTMANITSTFQLLPGCDGCLVMNMNSTMRDLDKLLHQMKFSSNITGDEISVHQLFLIGREPTLKDEDMENFRKQASCLGFSGEPGFRYDPKNGFCAEGEGVKITG